MPASTARCACQPPATSSIAARSASRVWVSTRRTCSPASLSSNNTSDGASPAAPPHVSASTRGGSQRSSVWCATMGRSYCA
ncbi:hypothetical protein L559_1849 [Bordetella pertussis STO1-CHOC-0017]|nr:hypothetical protein L559_1849 [Bordetella pertussis STO1-CHOC-0017]